jgi:signal transduction histidine kinase
MNQVEALPWLRRLTSWRQHRADAESVHAPSVQDEADLSLAANMPSRPIGTWLIETDEFGRIASLSPLGPAHGSLSVRIGESLCTQMTALSPSVGLSLERARLEQRSRHVTGFGNSGDEALWLSVDFLPGERPGCGQVTLNLYELVAGGDSVAPSDLVESLKRKSVLTLALREFLAAVATDVTFETTLPFHLRALAAAFLCDTAALFVVDPGSETVTLTAESRRGRKVKQLALEGLADPIFADLLQRPRLVEFDSALPVSEALAATMVPGYRYVTVSPCSSLGQTRGFLLLSSRHPEPLEAQQIDALDVVATALGQWMALRQLDRQKTDLESVVSTQQATAQAISRNLDVDHTYRAVARSVSIVVKDSDCLLFAREDESSRFKAVASSAYDAWELAGCTVNLDGGAAAVEFLLHEQPFLAPGFSEAHGICLSANVIHKTDGRPIVLMPMVVRDELLGLLLLYPSRRGRKQYSANELHRAESFAEQAAIAISNARLHCTLEESTDRIKSLLVGVGGVREREQRRFASIVHDDIVQSVVGAVYELEALRDDAPDALIEDLDRTVDLLRRSIDDARRVISELRAPVLEGMGLAESLQLLAERLDRQVPARVKADVRHIPGLSAQASAACYRMAREALTNAIRHASADVIKISMKAEWTLEGRVLYLTIEDDGIGIENTRPQDLDHYGLAMMEEQAAMLGGQMSAALRPGGGTLVSISLPLAQGRNREKVATGDG